MLDFGLYKSFLKVENFRLRSFHIYGHFEDLHLFIKFLYTSFFFLKKN